LIRAEISKFIGLCTHFLKRIVNAVEAHIVAALQCLDVFWCYVIDPLRNRSAMLMDVCIYAARKRSQNLVNVRIDLVPVFDDALLGPQQALQIISVPTILMLEEMQVAPEGSRTLHFGAASLCVAILKHHLLQVVFCLGIPITEESGLFGLTDNMRYSVVVPIDGYLPGKPVCAVG